MIDKKAQGKKNRRSGAKFELEVRKDLESKGWICAKWTNNVAEATSKNPLEWEGGLKLIAAKPKFNPFSKALSLGTGFPDFIALTRVDSNATWPIQNEDGNYSLSGIRCWIGVEAKSNGYLDKEEKEKCRWLLANNIFSKILIAKKGKDGEIIYNEFKAD